MVQDWTLNWSSSTLQNLLGCHWHNPLLSLLQGSELLEMQVCAEWISVHQQASFSLFESPKLSLDSRISSNWDATLQLGFSSSAATLYLESCGGEEASPFVHELLSWKWDLHLIHQWKWVRYVPQECSRETKLVFSCLRQCSSAALHPSTHSTSLRH